MKIRNLEIGKSKHYPNLEKIFSFSSCLNIKRRTNKGSHNISKNQQ